MPEDDEYRAYFERENRFSKPWARLRQQYSFVRDPTQDYLFIYDLVARKVFEQKYIKIHFPGLKPPASLSALIQSILRDGNTQQMAQMIETIKNEDPEAVRQTFSRLLLP